MAKRLHERGPELQDYGRRDITPKEIPDPEPPPKKVEDRIKERRDDFKQPRKH
jgi:hypothetical protein